MTGLRWGAAVLLVAALPTASVVRAQSTGGYSFFKVAGDEATHRDGPRAEARLRSPTGVVKDSAGNLYVSDGLTVRKVSPAGLVTTLAGTAGQSGTQDGTGAAARFVRAGGISIAATGDIFVADAAYVETSSLAAVRRITPAGVVTTVGTWTIPPNLLNTIGIAVDDRDGSVVIGNITAHTIDRMAPDGTITIIAGATGQRGAVDGAAGAARFSAPAGVAVDVAGVIYVADSGTHTIRRIGTDGVVSTWAGLMGDRGPGTSFGFGSSYEGLEGFRTDARFVTPEGISLDRATGRMLVAAHVSSESKFGYFSSRTRLFQIDATGLVVRRPFHTLLIGTASVWEGDDVIAAVNTAIVSVAPDGALGRVAGTLGGCSPHFSIDGGPREGLFCGVGVVAAGPDSVMYVADANCTIRKVTPGGFITTLAGGRLQPGTADGVGAAARFGGTPSSPGTTGCSFSIAVGANGVVYVADKNASTIRAVASDGTVTTLAGVADEKGTADGTGAAARFDQPFDLAVDRSGNLFVADTGSSTIRKVTPAGVVTTVAGTPRVGGSSDGMGPAALFLAPWGIDIGADDSVYIADTGNHTIRKMTPAGLVSTIGGSPGNAGTVNGSGPGVRFNQPRTISVDPEGNLFVTSDTTRLVTSGGVVSTFLEPLGVPGTCNYVSSIKDIDAAGTLYLASACTVLVGSIAGEASAVPAVTSQPASQTVTAGGAATFTVAASGVPAPTYRWQLSTDGGAAWTDITDGGVYSGALTQALTVNPASVQYPLRRFRAIATNAFGSATSNAATLTVPGLLVQPSSLRFRMSATGNGIGVPQELLVTFVGVAPSTLAWTRDVPWLELSTVSGNTQIRRVSTKYSSVLIGATEVEGHITVSAAGVQSVQVPVTLRIGGSTSAPVGQVDTPVQGATGVRGAIALSGWAIDDFGVSDVRVYRNCLIDEPQVNCQAGVIPGRDSDRVVELGAAQLVPGARPDIEAAFPQYPGYRAGWGFLILSNMLPRATGTYAPYGGQGPVTLYAVARDTEGQRTLLGRSWSNDATPTTVTLDNDAIAKPFGTLDTPAQGERIQSAFYANFGWVLTPDIDTTSGNSDIAMSNTTGLTVFVDGLPITAITYNQCRGTVGNPPPSGVYCDDDIANIFGNLTPQSALMSRSSNPTKFRNLDSGRGAIGSAIVDVTGLSNGLHTIAWSATDSDGRVEGIGSRYFSVLRQQTAPATDSAGSKDPASENRTSAFGGHSLFGGRVFRPGETGAVLGRAGFDLSAPWIEVTPDSQSVHQLRITELGRIELTLGGVATIDVLPVGAHLDATTGHFTWMPGPGFVGTYPLSFERGGTVVRVTVTIEAARELSTTESEIQMTALEARGSRVTGRAYDSHAFTGHGIGAIHVWGWRVDVPGAPPVFLGTAAIAPDGTYTFDTSKMERGVWDVTAYAWALRTARFEDARTLRITVR